MKETSIRQKLITAMLIVSSSVLVLTATVFISYEFTQSKKAAARNLTILAKAIAANSTAAVVYDDNTVAKELLSALSSQPDVVLACLYDRSGKFFAAYNPTELPSPAKPAPDGVHVSGLKLVVVQPVIQGNIRVGTLQVQQSLRAMYQHLELYVAAVLVVMFASAILAFLLSQWFERRIAGPVLNLAHVAQQISGQKDFSLRAPEASGFELRLLTRAFNEMLAEIQTRQSQLIAELAARKQVEEALSRAHGLLKTALDGMTDAFAIYDRDWKFVVVNSAALRQWRKTEHEVLGKNFWTVFPELHRTELHSALERCMNNRSASTFEFQPPGSGKWFEYQCYPIEQGVAVFMSDITERKSARQILERTVAERTAELRATVGELEAFSYSISHDMRAPLRAIGMYAEVLKEDFGPQLPAESLGYLQKITAATRRMDQLITDVLAYSRVNRDDMKPEIVDADALIRQIISENPALHPPNCRVENAIPAVLGHHALMAQCVSNFLNNAVKFMAPGVTPVLRIHAEPAADPAMVRIWFEDNGIGISAKDVERIFQIFERIHSQEQYEGTGIGLAIVKKAAERMRGRVGVESTPGQGSRFWLELKRAPATEAPAGIRNVGGRLQMAEGG